MIFSFSIKDTPASGETFITHISCLLYTSLASAVCGECDELYQYRPGDDTTVAVMRIIEQKTVHLMTGPPVDRDDDRKMVEDFMAGEGVKRIVSGGTTATILSRILGRQLQVSIDYYDPDIPPIAHMELSLIHI